MQDEYLDMDEIGHIAKLIDTEMTMFQRMKIKKSSIFKIITALLFYAVVMIFFLIFL